VIFSRHFRRVVAALATVALLYAQAAVAMHACAAMPMKAPGADSEAQTAHGPAPCDGGKVDEPALCFHHCQDARQAVDHSQPPAPGFVATLIYHFERPQDGASFFSVGRSRSDELLTRVTAPPVAVRNCCFRT
jgi:hypothetical protein